MKPPPIALTCYNSHACRTNERFIVDWMLEHLTKKYTSHFRVGHWHYIQRVHIYCKRIELFCVDTRGLFIFGILTFFLVYKDIFIWNCILFRIHYIVLVSKRFLQLGFHWFKMISCSNILSHILFNRHAQTHDLLLVTPNNEIKLWLWFGNCKHHICAFNGLNLWRKFEPAAAYFILHFIVTKVCFKFLLIHSDISHW